MKKIDNISTFLRVMSEELPEMKWDIDGIRNVSNGKFSGDQASFTIHFNGSGEAIRIMSDDPIGKYRYESLNDLYDYLVNKDQSKRIFSSAYKTL